MPMFAMIGNGTNYWFLEISYNDNVNKMNHFKNSLNSNHY